MFFFCTDAVKADVLFTNGQLDAVIRATIQAGMNPLKAIYAATHTLAMRMRLFAREQTAPDILADFVLLDDLQSLHIHSAYKAGKKGFDAKQGPLSPLAVPTIKAKHLLSSVGGSLSLPVSLTSRSFRERAILVKEREGKTTFIKFAQQKVPGSTTPSTSHPMPESPCSGETVWEQCLHEEQPENTCCHLQLLGT